MRLKVLLPFLFIALLCAVLQSCSSTKFVPEGEYLLSEANIKTKNKSLSTIELESYIKQKPNYRTFRLFKLPLGIYNLSGQDSTRWWNRALRSAGEPPVIFDSTMIERSEEDLTRVMVNKGYLDAEVTSSLELNNKKKAKVSYYIQSNKPYRINDYTIMVPDSVIDTSILPESMLKSLNLTAKQRRMLPSLSTDTILARNSYLKKGDMFDLGVLDEERSRIASVFRRTGYYAFDKEYIGFVADTAVGGNKVDLDLTIYPFSMKSSEGNIIHEKHRRYIVKEVNIYVDYNPLSGESISDFTASDIYQSGNYKILYGERGNYIRPQVVLNNCFIEPGKLFDENRTTQTYRALSQLRILKNVSISYTELIEGDSTMLRCNITCVPDKKQGFSAEVEGTNSGGFLGVESGLGYQHRNIFRGSEQFSIKARGAYEALTSSFSNFDNNYFEIGGETSILFPRFMVPFLNSEFKRSVHASTEFSASYTYQRRPGYFTRTILNSGIKYIWQSKNVTAPRHTIDLVDISYVHVPTLDSTFNSSLTENARQYSFKDQFIMSIGYTYSKSNLLARRKGNYGRPFSSIRASVESAGDVLALAAKIGNVKKESDGTRKIFGTRYVQYVRGTTDYSQTIHIDEKNSFAWHIGGGIAYPHGNIKEIPIQKRFYAGGANSVRGWGVRELGPGSFHPSDRKYDNFYYHSGDIRFEANMEYRSKVFWVLELAAFVDAGNIWTIRKYEGQKKGDFKVDRFYKEIALAWGLGFRFDFDFVLIRLDCGWKAYDPARKPGESSSDQWKIKNPFDMGHNTAWHIAVGYPF
ncbi:BamA/TamA family outer membrane protein [Dysgonomonas sp. 25]|uniref:translocation and assembly module lipoprotein TamL n=1 Tax=Dysgonomonas sp. 25 TaxID=2302933 RepID=UPI0013D3BFED|nr:BamA/TamA family outer membrane protein [Dysgonomonas sp. 25]NDV69669.1 outer membrane protein assembly factor [Dysgonomonas sp. 25]